MNLQDNVSLDVNLKVTSELAQAVTPSTDMAWQWLEGLRDAYEGLFITLKDQLLLENDKHNSEKIQNYLSDWNGTCYWYKNRENAEKFQSQLKEACLLALKQIDAHPNDRSLNKLYNALLSLSEIVEQYKSYLH